GGWGETCASYMDDRLRGVGPSTASQTSWALMALLATRSRDYDAAIRAGVKYLTETQRDDGTWDEPYYTGTGFPGYGFGAKLDFRDAALRERIAQGTELQRGFMLNYNMYRHYFPLMALGRARRYFGGCAAPGSAAARPRLGTCGGADHDVRTIPDPGRVGVRTLLRAQAPRGLSAVVQRRAEPARRGHPHAPRRQPRGG